MNQPSSVVGSTAGEGIAGAAPDTTTSPLSALSEQQHQYEELRLKLRIDIFIYIYIHIIQESP